MERSVVAAEARILGWAMTVLDRIVGGARAVPRRIERGVSPARSPTVGEAAGAALERTARRARTVIDRIGGEVRAVHDRTARGTRAVVDRIVRKLHRGHLGAARSPHRIRTRLRPLAAIGGPLDRGATAELLIPGGLITTAGFGPIDAPQNAPEALVAREDLSIDRTVRPAAAGETAILAGNSPKRSAERRSSSRCGVDTTTR